MLNLYVCVYSPYTTGCSNHCYKLHCPNISRNCLSLSSCNTWGKTTSTYYNCQCVIVIITQTNKISDHSGNVSWGTWLLLCTHVKIGPGEERANNYSEHYWKIGTLLKNWYNIDWRSCCLNQVSKEVWLSLLSKTDYIKMSELCSSYIHSIGFTIDTQISISW